MAREACDRGKVFLNDKPARGSATVRSGDTIRLELGPRTLEIKTLMIPQGAVAKKNAPDYYDVIRDEREELD